MYDTEHKILAAQGEDGLTEETGEEPEEDKANLDDFDEDEE